MSVFKSYKNVKWYQPILEDKLRTIFLNGLNEYAHLDNCINKKVYPEFTFKRTAFELTRLIENVIDLDYFINCENKLDKRELLDIFTNEYLIQDLRQFKF